jgi:hypothetical protein
MELWKKFGILIFTLITMGVVIIAFKVLNSQPSIKQEVRINTLCDSLSFTLYAPKSDPVYLLSLEANAEINGNAKVQLNHYGTVPPKIFNISTDSPNFIFDGDWYHDHVTVTITTDNLTSGSLSFSYTFYQ